MKRWKQPEKQETWKRLAAEFEADEMLLQTLAELHFGSVPYEALLLALNIRPTGK